MQGRASAAATPDAASGRARATGSRTIADSIHLSSKDINRRAVDVFGDSLRGSDSTATPSWDIEVRSYETTDRVEYYVRLFSGSAKERIEARLARGTRYEAMIRAKMREGGLPEDMYYLALIESGFDPNAYSRAAAVGMWQFMTSTARGMGLRVDWWIDERRDPVKSTTAAVRFIKDLKEQFGSLYLAAAAYNGGPGRVARGLSRYADDLEGTTGDDRFFALAEKDYLRSETRDYVPQLIAAALIAKEPDRYGMTLTQLPSYAYDSARVGPATPLAAVATASASTVGELQELNPQILRGMTPPKDSFIVRIPVGRGAGFAAALASMPRNERVAVTTVESKKGQSVKSIADGFGLSARQLSLYNPSLKRLHSGNLAAGQTVLVPSEAVASAAAPVPDPAIERYSSQKVGTTHVVKPGETLSMIAARYHTTRAALMHSNGLRRGIVFPGQSLVIRGAGNREAESRQSGSPKGGANGKARAKKSARKESGSRKS